MFLSSSYNFTYPHFFCSPGRTSGSKINKIETSDEQYQYSYDHKNSDKCDTTILFNFSFEIGIKMYIFQWLK